MSNGKVGELFAAVKQAADLAKRRQCRTFLYESQQGELIVSDVPPAFVRAIYWGTCLENGSFRLWWSMKRVPGLN